MLLDLAADLGLPPRTVGYEYTLREGLALWLRARRKRREQQAEALELAVMQMENAAALSGRKIDIDQHYRPFREQISRLRQPEWLPEMERAADSMTPDQRLVLYGRRQLAEMDAERLRDGAAVPGD